MKLFYSIALLLCLSSCSMINGGIFSKKTQQSPKTHTQNCTLSDDLSSQVSINDMVAFGRLQNQIINCYGFTGK